MILIPNAYASTFFEFSSSSVSDMLGYAKSFFTDATPLLLPIIGIAVGIMILYAIVGAIR